MKKATRAESQPDRITVLSVGPVDEDHAVLAEIMSGARGPLSPGSRWTVKSAAGLPAALSELAANQTPIVICDSDLGAATWRDLRDQIALLPDPPSLIVASRQADERLWAEALNLGAYDVLAKPFDAAEVTRTLNQAWLHRTYRRAKQGSVLTAVGHPHPELKPRHTVAV